jgi:hypothetical protein
MSASGAEAAPPPVGMAVGRGVWVVLPTYNERENLEAVAAAILAALPEASLLVVDDRSPDGTGELADTLAAREPRVAVLHRPGKEGLGVAYRDGFRWVLERPETRAVVQMDADFSHDPGDLPRLLAPLMESADLVLGTRYMPGGETVGWPWYRKLISRGGTLFARTVLLLPGSHRRLQGLAPRAARRDPAARDGRLGIRLPDRDDLVGASSWRAHRPGADRLPRAGRRRVEDERRHRAGSDAPRPGSALARDPRRGRPPVSDPRLVRPASSWDSMAPRRVAMVRTDRAPSPRRSESR